MSVPAQLRVEARLLASNPGDLGSSGGELLPPHPRVLVLQDCGYNGHWQREEEQALGPGVWGPGDSGREHSFTRQLDMMKDGNRT